MVMESRSRWIALIVLCMGSLMIVLDTTIVNVALPSIKTSLHFSGTSLAWVVNAYLLTFGGFLLLGGRLGDLYGHRRLFLIGITLFTLASLSCGLADSEAFLVTARAVQGLGGAITSAVALSLIMTLFTDPVERAKAMGVFVAIEARVRSPLMPLGLFRLRNLSTANGIGVLWAAAMFAWFFLTALYLHNVLGYSPLDVGLAFAPTSVIMGVFSLGLSAKLVMRFGIRRPLVASSSPATSGRLIPKRKTSLADRPSENTPMITLVGAKASPTSSGL